jgi:hypothetical protein
MAQIIERAFPHQTGNISGCLYLKIQKIIKPSDEAM